MGELWIVATPIGNLGDLTERAKCALRDADVIAAEDTRVTGALLHALGLHTRLLACHKFNERSASDRIISLLEEGKNVALVTDAGTPAVSDPGDTVARAVAQAGHPVVSFPGASAVITALSLSGLCPGRFSFHAFPPRGNRELSEFMKEIASSPIPTHVLYDSPHRIHTTLEAVKSVMPEAEICLCNDLTKLHERIYRGTAESVLGELDENPNAEKGEYCLVLRHEPETEKPAVDTPLPPEAELVALMVTKDLSLREARAALQETRPDLRKRDIYQASLRLNGLFGPDGGDE
jgi:16S rRNA (cytidine1402-2'-O)-methyltransferase